MRAPVLVLVAAAGLLALSAQAPVSAPGPSPSPGSAARPNIVFVVLDDLDSEALRVMPHTLRRVGEPGATFRQSFVAVPLCCPARTSILTGQYAHNHGVLSNVGAAGGFERFQARGIEKASLAPWLKAAGYRTQLAGKYMNHYPAGARPAYVPPGWDDWHAILEDRGAGNRDYWMNENGKLVKPAEYQTEKLAAVVEAFVRDSAGQAPFFVYLAPGAPHMPAEPSPRHLDLFAGEKAPRTPAFDEEDVSDKPAWLRRADALNDGDTRRIDRFYRRRLQTLVAADEMVERVFQALEQTGQLERTWVFFTSDNGFLQGQHRFPQGKNAPYEESIRVPLLVRGPGLPPGRVLDHLVSQVDYAPTWLELAGAPVPASVDGRSLLPLLGAAPPVAPAEWRQDLLVEHWETGDPFPIPDFFLLREPQRVYVEYVTGETEWYDLQADPDQLQSRHAQLPEAERKRLSERLKLLKNCRGSGCR